jgi:hypothetical protein
MAKKPKPDRADPRKNKSLAIRNVLKKMPTATAAEVVAAVKKEYGQTVNQNRVYMVKTKTNMASDGRVRISKAKKSSTPMTSPELWVEAIKTARQLLKATGSVPNAVALLKAVDG